MAITFFSLYSKRTVWQALALLAFVLAALYVVQINLVTDAAYLVSAQEQKLGGLRTAAKELEARHAARLSFEDFETLAADLGFEKITRMDYVEVRVPRVAQTEE